MKNELPQSAEGYPQISQMNTDLQRAAGRLRFYCAFALICAALLLPFVFIIVEVGGVLERL